jgi:Protein of unknown function (DUF1367)
MPAAGGEIVTTMLMLMKAQTGALIPMDPQAIEYIAKLKVGEAVGAEVKKVRNPKFHRKMFAMLNLAFDAWEPVEVMYRGKPVRKQFDQFRKDVTILAGFYNTTVTLKGEVRLTAKSMSFKSMDETEFEKVYSAIIDVVLSRILTKYTRNDLDQVVEQILAFS